MDKKQNTEDLLSIWSKMTGRIDSIDLLNKVLSEEPPHPSSTLRNQLLAIAGEARPSTSSNYLTRVKYNYRLMSALSITATVFLIVYFSISPLTHQRSSAIMIEDEIILSLVEDVQFDDILETDLVVIGSM